MYLRPSCRRRRNSLAREIETLEIRLVPTVNNLIVEHNLYDHDETQIGNDELIALSTLDNYLVSMTAQIEGEVHRRTTVAATADTSIVSGQTADTSDAATQLRSTFRLTVNGLKWPGKSTFHVTGFTSADHGQTHTTQVDLVLDLLPVQKRGQVAIVVNVELTDFYSRFNNDTIEGSAHNTSTVAFVNVSGAEFNILQADTVYAGANETHFAQADVVARTFGGTKQYLANMVANNESMTLLTGPPNLHDTFHRWNSANSIVDIQTNTEEKAAGTVNVVVQQENLVADEEIPIDYGILMEIQIPAPSNAISESAFYRGSWEHRWLQYQLQLGLN